MKPDSGASSRNPDFSASLEADHERQGDHAGALYYRGRQLMSLGKFDDAVAAFRESATALPHFKCLELLGECLLELGRPVEAIVPLAAAARLNRQVRAPALLSRALLRAGQAEEAAEIATEVLVQAPGNKVARRVVADPLVAAVLDAQKG